MGEGRLGPERPTSVDGTVVPSPETTINVPLPLRNRPGWRAALVLLSSGLLSVAAFFFSNYLQTRGFVSAELARVFLVATWVAVAVLIVVAVMALMVKRRAITMIMSLSILTLVLGGLEWKVSHISASAPQAAPAIVFIYNSGLTRLELHNQGKSALFLWGTQFSDDHKPTMEQEAREIPADPYHYYLDTDELERQARQNLATAAEVRTPLYLFVKDIHGSEFTVKCLLRMRLKGEQLVIDTQNLGSSGGWPLVERKSPPVESQERRTFPYCYLVFDSHAVSGLLHMAMINPTEEPVDQVQVSIMKSPSTSDSIPTALRALKERQILSVGTLRPQMSQRIGSLKPQLMPDRGKSSTYQVNILTRYENFSEYINLNRTASGAFVQSRELYRDKIHEAIEQARLPTRAGGPPPAPPSTGVVNRIGLGESVSAVVSHNAKVKIDNTNADDRMFIQFGTLQAEVKVSQLRAGWIMPDSTGYGVPPIRVLLRGDDLLVDAGVYSGPGKPPVEIRGAAVSDRGSGWDANADDRCFEVVTENRVPVFQLQYERDPHKVITISGIFPANGGVLAVKENVHQFNPRDPFGYYLKRVFKYPSRLHPGERALLSSSEGAK